MLVGKQARACHRIGDFLEEVMEGKYGTGDKLDYDAFLDEVDILVNDLDAIADGVDIRVNQ